MIDRRRFAFACAASSFAATLAICHASAQEIALFSQSASTLLARRFPGTALSWLLVDAQSRIIAENWADPARPVAPGSLLKPFIAVAWSQQNSSTFPVHFCRGAADRCWLPTGHGRLTLPQALAQSCNAYFLALASLLDAGRARVSFAGFGLRPPLSSLTPSDMIGLSNVWHEPPIALVHAYSALLAGAPCPALAEVVDGLRLATREGTAHGAALAFGSSDLLAKTGTAACCHPRRAPADGFALLLYPAATPRFLLLVREHGATGAYTAQQAGTMLRALGLGSS